MGEWLNNLWHSHTIEHYSEIKRNKLLTHSTTWMNINGITLSEKANLKRTHTAWPSIFVNNIIKDENRLPGVRDGGITGRVWGLAGGYPVTRYTCIYCDQLWWWVYKSIHVIKFQAHTCTHLQNACIACETWINCELDQCQLLNFSAVL